MRTRGLLHRAPTGIRRSAEYGGGQCGGTRWPMRPLRMALCAVWVCVPFRAPVRHHRRTDAIVSIPEVHRSHDKDTLAAKLRQAGLDPGDGYAPGPPGHVLGLGLLEGPTPLVSPLQLDEEKRIWRNLQKANGNRLFTFDISDFVRLRVPERAYCVDSVSVLEGRAPRQAVFFIDSFLASELLQRPGIYVSATGAAPRSVCCLQDVVGTWAARGLDVHAAPCFAWQPPIQIAALVSHRRWFSLVCPYPRSKRMRQTVFASVLVEDGTRSADADFYTCPDDQAALSSDRFHEAATCIQTLASMVPDFRSDTVQNPHPERWRTEKVTAWLLDQADRFGNVLPNVRRQFSAKALIECIGCCSFIRSKKHLRQAAERAVHMCLPGALESGFLETAKVPSGATISRCVLVTDCALMLHMQEHHQTALAAGCSIYLSLDASPQGGRNWLLTEYTLLLHPRVLSAVEAWRTLSQRAARKSVHDDDASAVPELEAALTSCVYSHVLPIGALGSGRASLAHKFGVLVQQIRLECADWSGVRHFCNAVVAVTSDFGTESLITDIPNIDVEDLFPHWLDVTRDGGDEPPNEVGESSSHPFQFPFALRIPGCLHILHNATHDITDHMCSFSRWQPMCHQVARLLIRRYSRERFVATCLDSAEAVIWKPRFATFNQTVLSWRFMSLVEFCDAMLRLETPLRMFWRRAKFQMGAAAAEEEEERGREAAAAAAAEAERLDVSRLDEAITSPFFWAFAKLICFVTGVLEDLKAFVVSCTCHSAGGADEEGQSGLGLFRKQRAASKTLGRPCPFKGRNAAGLAAGVHVEILQRSVQLYHVFLLESTIGCTERDREALLHDWHAASQQLKFVLELKFAFFANLPYILCGVGHWDESVGRALAAKAAILWSKDPPGAHHRYTVWFFQTFQAQLKLFAEGHAMAAEMGVEVAKLVCVSVVEHTIEGRHSWVKAAYGRGPHSSEALVDLELRSPELERRIFQSPPDLADFTLLWERVRKLSDLVARFGLAAHPSIVEAFAGGHSATIRRTIRAVLYHTNLRDQFTDLRRPQRVIGVAKKAQDLARAQRIQRRGLGGGSIPAVAFDRVLARAAFEYLQRSVRDDKYYSIPNVDGLTFQGIAEQLAPSCADEEELTRDDGGCVTDPQLQRSSPVGPAVFRPIHIHPSNKRRIDTVGDTLTSGSMAVSVHQSCAFEDGHLSVLLGASVPVSRFGPEHLLQVGIPRLTNELLQWATRTTFLAWPTARGCSDGDASLVARAIVDAKALPGCEEVLAVCDAMCRDGPLPETQVTMTLLQYWAAADRGFVENVYSNNLVSAWRVTERGLVSLCPSVLLSEPLPVLRVRTELPPLQWTLWELLRQLEDAGWQQRELSRRGEPPAISLAAAAGALAPGAGAADAARIWYRGPRQTRLDRNYLLCLVCMDRLKDGGVTAIRHRQPARYYRALLQQAGVTEPSGELPPLCDDIERPDETCGVSCDGGEVAPHEFDDGGPAPVSEDAGAGQAGGIARDVGAVTVSSQAGDEAEDLSGAESDGLWGLEEEDVVADVDVGSLSLIAGDGAAGAVGAAAESDGASIPRPAAAVAATPAAEPRSRRPRPDPANHQWGPFDFTVVQRGGEAKGWQATCHYHRDDVTATGGLRCRKSALSTPTASMDDVLRRLKAWCLMYSEYTHRKKRRGETEEDGHQDVDVWTLTVPSDEELNRNCPAADLRWSLMYGSSYETVSEGRRRTSRRAKRRRTGARGSADNPPTPTRTSSSSSRDSGTQHRSRSHSSSSSSSSSSASSGNSSAGNDAG